MNIQQKAYSRFESIGLPKARHDDWIFFPNSAFQKINVISPEENFSESISKEFDLGIDTEKNIAALIPLIHTRNTFLKTIDANAQETGVLKARDDFSHTLFHIQKGADVSLEILDNKNEHAFTAERLDFFVEENAKLELFFCNPLQNHSLQFRHVRIVAAAKASIKILGLQENTGCYRQSFDLFLNGEDSTLDFRLLNQLKGETEAHYHLTIHHNAPHTKNNQFVRQILNGKSHVSYDGAVHVGKDCTEVNSAQLINSILLSEEAKVSVKPVLKIYHDDVECTHGNTCGELDAESLYYLQSRGIDAKKAEEILLLNFASEVFSDLESSIGRERILHILANKN
jgi:Fe-S cluster assembly scaffold protein SufB